MLLLSTLVLAAAFSPVLALARGVGGPQGQVVPQELHDQCAVLITILVQGVKLCYGVVKSLRDATNQRPFFLHEFFKVFHLFSELTGLVRRGHYFVVEYREIQG